MRHCLLRQRLLRHSAIGNEAPIRALLYGPIWNIFFNRSFDRNVIVLFFCLFHLNSDISSLYFGNLAIRDSTLSTVNSYCKLSFVSPQIPTLQRFSCFSKCKDRFFNKNGTTWCINSTLPKVLWIIFRRHLCLARMCPQARWQLCFLLFRLKTRSVSVPRFGDL